MQLQEIRDEVSILVADDSYVSKRLDNYINQCFNYLNTIIGLPGRKSITSIDTVVGQAHVSLTNVTGGFNGTISKAICSSGSLRIYPNLELLFDDYADSDNVDLLETGTLEGVAVEGNTFWYQPVPTTSTSITVMYYSNIPLLTTDSDVPNDIPEALHRRLFVYGTAWIIFDQIEEDVEEAKVNASSFFYQSFDEKNRHSGITKLREWVGRNRKHYISSSWSV